MGIECLSLKPKQTLLLHHQRVGFALAFTWGDPPTFAGVNLGKMQMFLQMGTPHPKGCCVYFLIGDADVLYEFHRANGVEVVQEIGDENTESETTSCAT